MASTATQFTACKHCKRSYKDPRILSCLHSYCLQCITKIHVQGTTSITCPSCNHPTLLPDGGVASLPANIRLKEEAEQDKVLQQVTSYPLPKCGSCEDDSSVSVAYCKDCNFLLCQKCLSIHQKVNPLRSHETSAIEDLKKSKSHLLKMPPSSFPQCPDHHHQELGFYCTQCAFPVCVGCTISRHKDHLLAVEEVSERITQDKKTEILQGIEGLPEKKEQLEQVMKTIDEVKKNLKLCKDEVNSTVNKAFAKLHQLIDHREKALLEESSQIAIAKEKNLSIQQEGLQHLLESISQCHSLASIATSQYSDVHLLSIAHTLQSRAVSLQQQFTDTSLDLCETPDISVEINTDPLASMIEEFGIVADSSTSSTHTITVVPSQRLDLGTEMGVAVTARDESGNILDIGRTDCAEIKDPVQIITGVISPRYIAFSDSCDMFVTCTGSKHCINVYDRSGKKKTTIGSRGSGELQFESPYGIAISGEVVYVSEKDGNRIHKLTTEGEFLGTFGEKGADIGQFDRPHDVKISLDEKVYVADTFNHRIQVFHPDWTISHVIDGRVSGNGRFTSPEGIAFDRSGNVHVAGFASCSVAVFTPSGQFVRQYDKEHTKSPTGIAIDPSGRSLVTEYYNSVLSIFDASGKFIQSVGGFKSPFGVSVSPDGSIWVADSGNGRLVKY